MTYIPNSSPGQNGFTKRANSTTVVSSSHLLDVLLQNNNVSMTDGEQANLLFRLLRQEDLCMSMAWHSIWHGLELTP
ncbi:MAG: hypothetical protein V3S54_09325 [Woeseiaceae bacterium]